MKYLSLEYLSSSLLSTGCFSYPILSTEPLNSGPLVKCFLDLGSMKNTWNRTLSIMLRWKSWLAKHNLRQSHLKHLSSLSKRRTILVSELWLRMIEVNSMRYFRILHDLKLRLTSKALNDSTFTWKKNKNEQNCFVLTVT